MKLQRFGVAAALAVALAIPVTAFAGGKHGGGGGGGNPAPTAGCAVSGNTVSASGLPTDQVINFMVTSGAGTTGWVLGYTSDGTWNVAVPTASGPTTYQFVSATWGPGGSKYTVFASCSV